MFPTHDMNPIAIEHFRRELLTADIAFVDRPPSSISTRVIAPLFRLVRSLRPKEGSETALKIGENDEGETSS